MPRVSALVLAAGASMRMGQQKALLPWRGTSLLEYQLDQLGAVPDIAQVIVVTGSEPDRITALATARGATVVHNAAWASGKVGSILAGLGAIASGADAVLLLAVDQPRDAALHRALIEARDAADGLIAAPTHAGRRGHPLVFSRALLPELLTISEQTAGVRDVMGRHAGEILDIEWDDSVLLDLNRPGDVADAGDARRA